MRVVTRVLQLTSEKQIRENRRISVTTIARETGLSRPTITNWINNELGGFDKQTIVIFCKYFGCGVGDLLVLEDEQ